MCEIEKQIANYVLEPPFSEETQAAPLFSKVLYTPLKLVIFQQNEPIIIGYRKMATISARICYFSFANTYPYTLCAFDGFYYEMPLVLN